MSEQEQKQEQQAIAYLVGEIANDMKATPGGLVVMNILVKRTTPRGGVLKQYVPVKWFGDLSDDVIDNYAKGDTVTVKCEVSMNKPPGDKYFQVQLIGAQIKKVRAADVANNNDDIPW